jgi:hypothetical protein
MPHLKFFAPILLLIMSLSASAGTRTTHWVEYRGTLDPSQAIGTHSESAPPSGSAPLAPGQCYVTMEVNTNGDSSMTYVGHAFGRPIWVRSTRKTAQGADQWYGFDGNNSQVTLDLDLTGAPSSMTYWVEGTNHYGQNDGTVALRRTCTGLKLFFENWHR